MGMKLIGFLILLGATVSAVVMNSQNSNEKISTKTQSAPVEKITEKSAKIESIEAKEPVEEVGSDTIAFEEVNAAEVSESNEPVEESASAAPVIEAEVPAPKITASKKKIPTKAKQAKSAEKVEAPKDTKEAEAKTADAVDTKKEDEVSTQNAAVQLTGNLANMVGSGNGNKFSGSIEAGINTDLKPVSDDTKVSSSSVYIRPRYQINSTYAVQGTIWVDKGLSQGYEDTLRDTRVALVHSPLKLSETVMISPNITSTLPTSEMSKRNQELIMGLEFNPNVIYQPNNLLTVFYTPRARKNFHEYTTSRTDVVNTDYSFTQIAGLSYSLSDRWSVTPILIYSQSWSYEGTQRDPSYMTILEMRYQATAKVYGTFGTLTGGSLYEAERGPDQFINLYDENTTSVYANVGILF